MNLKRHLLTWIVLTLALTAWGTGCSSGGASVRPPDEPTATGGPTLEAGGETEMPTPTVPAPEATETPRPSAGERMVELARRDLARRLDLDAAEVRVMSVEAVDWPDASLGCPQPGMAYTQVVTPGFRVVLEAEGRTYEYHTDRGRLMVLCGDDGRPAYPVIPVDPDEILDGEPWMPVD